MVIEAVKTTDPKTQHLFDLQRLALSKYFIPNIIVIPEWPKINDMAWPKLQLAVGGERDITATLNDIASGIRSILKNAGYYD